MTGMLLGKVYELVTEGLCFRNFVDRRHIFAAVQLLNMKIGAV